MGSNAVADVPPAEAVLEWRRREDDRRAYQREGQGRRRAVSAGQAAVSGRRAGRDPSRAPLLAQADSRAGRHVTSLGADARHTARANTAAPESRHRRGLHRAVILTGSRR
ncbi:hypothetical protein [Streptomyces sp. NPDC004546]|uniref:hypothetical protein n=1 Tax=Streptomyces sp. NPDC004546 TaxID=3154282 RepID=UPI0033A3BF54